MIYYILISTMLFTYGDKVGTEASKSFMIMDTYSTVSECKSHIKEQNTTYLSDHPFIIYKAMCVDGKGLQVYSQQMDME